jgi:5-methylthioadenosine/S-adenosylhomocysteine deaminase
MEKVDLIIRNGIILKDPNAIPFKGCLCVDEGRIVAIGKTEKISRTYRAERYVDANEKAVLPGFVDAHMHECLLRGLCEDLPLMKWLEEITLPVERVLSKGDMKAASFLNQLEMIKSGITAFIDLFRFQEEAAKVANLSGLRAFLSSQIMDKPYRTETVATNKRLVRNWNGKANGRITTWFGAHASYSCSQETLLKIKELAQKYGVGIHIHVSETRDEVKIIKKEHGLTPVGFLNKIGLLNDHVNAAHCVYLTNDDIRILKDRKVSVVYNPTSNMKLASGIAPIPDLLTEGIPVGLGTDSILSNNNLDMFEEMRIGSFLQKLARMDASVLPCREIFKMATVGGAKCVRREEEIGTLEVGKKGDIILINLMAPHLSPILLENANNLLENIVYSANGADVDTTIVDGKILMESREVKTLDEHKILEMANRVAYSLYERAKEMK